MHAHVCALGGHPEVQQKTPHRFGPWQSPSRSAHLQLIFQDKQPVAPMAANIVASAAVKNKEMTDKKVYNF